MDVNKNQILSTLRIKLSLSLDEVDGRCYTRRGFKEGDSQMAQSAEKNIKERSSLYPMFSIKEIVDFINEIVKIGGKRVSINTIASVLGFSVKTNSFRAKISTAKQFGLIRGSNGAVELTELAKRIVYPVNELDTRRAIVESFLSAPLYRKIVERYENQVLPSQDKLSNILLLEYNLTKSAKDIAAAKFIGNAEQVGILKNGIILLESDENDIDSFEDESSSKDSKEVSENSTAESKEEVLTSMEPSAYCFTIPTLSGSVAKVIIPQNVTEKDLDFITLYIENMLPTFISNLKEELEK